MAWLRRRPSARRNFVGDNLLAQQSLFVTSRLHAPGTVLVLWLSPGVQSLFLSLILWSSSLNWCLYAQGVYTCVMLANSQTVDCHAAVFKPVAPWSPSAHPGLRRTALASSLPSPIASQVATKDTLIASAFLCGYMAIYLAAGFVGLSAIEWVWTYLTN